MYIIGTSAATAIINLIHAIRNWLQVAFSLRHVHAAFFCCSLLALAKRLDEEHGPILVYPLNVLVGRQCVQIRDAAERHVHYGRQRAEVVIDRPRHRQDGLASLVVAVPDVGRDGRRRRGGRACSSC